MPNAKRGAPRTGSMPIIETSSPSTVIMHRRHERAPGEAAHQAEAEQHQREELRRPELERELRERRRDERQRHTRHHAADERTDRRDAERGAAAALLRHLVAVEAGDHGRRLAGHVDSTDVIVPPYIAP